MIKSKFSFLFDIFRKTDYRDKENSGIKKLVGIILAYLVSNAALSFNFFSIYDEYSFIFMTFSANLFLIGIIILNEFDNLFLATRNYDMLIILPVNSRDIFSAKFLSALLYMSYFIIACILPQSVFFYQYEFDLTKTFLYAFSNILFCYTAISVLVFVYLFLLISFTSKAHILLNLIQILFFVFVFYSSSLSFRLKDKEFLSDAKLSIRDFDFSGYMPQSFYSDSVGNLLHTVICTVIFILVISSLYYYISAKYNVLLEKFLSFDKSKKKRKHFNFSFYDRFVNKYVLKNNYEAATYHLIKHQLKNSRFLRLKFIPFAMMPLMITVVAFFSGIPEMLIFKPSTPNSFLKTDLFLISPTITLMIVMSSTFLVSSTKILDDKSSDTDWIFSSLAISDRRLIIGGINKFIYLNFIIPVVLLTFILISLKAEFIPLLLNMLFIMTSVYFILTLKSLTDKTYPFTLESSKFNSASKLVEILFSMLIGVAVFLIQIFVFQNIIFVIIFIVVFLIISILLNKK